MVYILETELNTEKPIYVSLQKIFGVGQFTSKKICKSLGFLINLKTKDLNKLQILQLTKKIESLNIIVSSDLKKQISKNNLKYISIKSYKGLRKLQGLPIRGQRTHTNAQTAKRKNRSNL